jgi:diadenosine tetraphosphate (Ap4A) HIT family hydrolase
MSMTEARLADLRNGVGCPFCGVLPDETDAWSKVGTLQVSSLYLQRNQTYRGYGILVFDPRHATRLTELSADERGALCNDIYIAQSVIEQVALPDHVNVASLGNQVPHLHWHIIPRYINDSRWGGSIWTTREEEMKVVRLPDEEHRNLLDALRAELAVQRKQARTRT